MNSCKLAEGQIPVVLVRPQSLLFGDRAAYEAGRSVGQIAAYIVIGAIVVWLVLKAFKR